MMLKLLISAIVVLQAADIYTTYVVLRSGRGREANPIVDYVIKKLGLVPGLLAVKVPLLATLPLLEGAPGLTAAGVLTAVYLFVIYNNVKVMNELNL